MAKVSKIGTYFILQGFRESITHGIPIALATQFKTSAWAVRVTPTAGTFLLKSFYNKIATVYDNICYSSLQIRIFTIRR